MAGNKVKKVIESLHKTLAPPPPKKKKNLLFSDQWPHIFEFRHFLYFHNPFS